MDIKEKIAIIHNLMCAKKFTQAIINSHKLIKLYPNVSYLYNLCGMAYQGNNQIKKSVESFNIALNHDPENLAAMNNLANSYKSLNYFNRAEEIYEKVLRKDPNNIKCLNNFSNLKQTLRDYETAKKLLLKALEIEEKNLNILFNLAECYQSLGELDQAKDCALKILNLQPNHTAAHRFICGIINHRSDKSYFPKIIEIEKSDDFKNFSSEEKKDIYFSLGKAYEDNQDYEKSFNYLQKGNLIKNKEINYNQYAHEKLIKSIIKLFHDFDFEKIKKKKLQNKIIFICGMPRSGSTLIEQMIASHEEVSGAGELSYLRDVVAKNFLQDFKFNKQKLIEEASLERNIIAEEYIEILKYHKFKTNIVTDKAPQNFLWMGFIKIFFPNSKIIHSYRNPRDNCLSIYKNYFPSNDMLWSFDQTNIANYYNSYLDLMDFWKNKFKDSILDVNYERLVEFPEDELKKIFSFCNLTWDPNCLNFYKTKKTPISTVSVNQASKPIYKSSVNSNEGFSKYLTEMFHILDTKK
ncbi:tetratricopeptide repeat-containing sulfotransferase family protein [Candidatus Pelagibacter communis]|uniref:tetratricopeptide repeat-containing sulfotransferase family protein n=1 Tax=Pelagibacter ubique TaxID=198252 RepID=UPI00092D3758|nr:tetratricopeptide repeat-containing sulfotransferase family protein [Candidatus Pelagibacter ubique]